MKKFIISILVILLCAVIGFVGFFGFMAYKDYQEVTSVNSIDSLVYEIESSSTFVNYDDLPADLIRATTSIEDRRFYEHSGVDVIGLTRGILSQFIPSLLKSGGSTITQQVAKNLYSMFDSNVQWKFTEYFLAKELESKYSKNEILTIYVNIINYGDNHMGIYEASIGYFGVYPSDLTTAQCSLLAGIPQSPSNYQLSDHYDKAKTRQYQVLEAMEECGYISEYEIDTIYNTSVY